jgi:hypothetical protein
MRALSFLLLVTAACSGPAPAQAAAGPPAPVATAQADPLPSWNDGPSRRAIVDFVTRVTKEGGPDFVPVPERIATFDNDGTLWSEKPVPFQVVFAFGRVNALAPQHPEWKSRPPFEYAYDRDDKLQQFNAGWDEAVAKGWTVVSMKDDWKVVYPAQ